MICVKALKLISFVKLERFSQELYQMGSIKMYKYIVFDVDGTLIDTEKAAISSLQVTFNEVLGKKYEYEELIFSLGIPFEKIISKLNIKKSVFLKTKYLENLKNGLAISIL